MPFKIRLLGISGDRATIAIDGSYRGNAMTLDRKTFSLTPGEEINMTLVTNIAGFGDLPDQAVELEATPVIEPGLPYKIDWKS